MKVARMSQNGAVHFAIVYTLRNGAEIFGGGPVDHAVGLELGGEDYHYYSYYLLYRWIDR